MDKREIIVYRRNDKGELYVWDHETDFKCGDLFWEVICTSLKQKMYIKIVYCDNKKLEYIEED